MKFVVVTNHVIYGLSVIGDFDTKEAAAGWAYNEYGPANDFGAPLKWKALEKRAADAKTKNNSPSGNSGIASLRDEPSGL